jgi:hypothetical protein
LGKGFSIAAGITAWAGENDMVKIRSAVETFRYWNQTSQVCAEQARQVDRVALRSDLRQVLPDGKRIERALLRDGIAVIADYWPADKCAAGRDEIDRLISTYPQAVQTSSGDSDKRMFGIESVSPLLAEFHYDPVLSRIGELIGGFTLYNFATLGARIDASPLNNGSGDGWHRDGHGFQFKSILYLSDVSQENGPFQFLPGSHKQWRAAFDTAAGGLPPAPSARYEPEAIERMARHFGARIRQYPAKAGTVLLVNTAGIHRGKPLVSGSRYALTNYFYHPFQVGLNRVKKFHPLMPGTAERICADLSLS